MNDTELLLDIVGEAHAFTSLEEFRPGVLELLCRLVPCDLASYNEITPGEAVVLFTPEADESLLPVFTELAYQNPLIANYARTRDGRPYRLSDVISRSAYHALELYQRVYGPMGVEYQVAFTLPAAPPLIVGLVANRHDNDFTEREVRRLALVRPHLMRAYRNAELHGARTAVIAALERGLDTAGSPVVVVDAHGRVEFASASATRLLRGDGLPEAVTGWLETPEQPLVLEDGRVVRALPRRAGDPRQVLMVEGAPGELTAAALQALGLTAREADVLHAVALGRSPEDAAGALGIARRTVDKHLQHIYAKLGSPTLGDAVAVAWAAVGVISGSP